MDLQEMNVFSNVETKIKKGSPAFGIDLGTTNSAISVLRNGKDSEIISVGINGSTTMPSCVMWKGDDKFIIGEEAYKNRHKDSVIYSVKRLMGTEEKVTLRYGGKSIVLTPTEVSSLILKELVKRASIQYGDIKDVVISIPAHFNDLQIRDTIKAGELAGLNVLTTIKEPTSAAINYEDLQEESNIVEKTLVYDLGGGTFDITLLEINKITSEDLDDDLYCFADDNSEKVCNTVLTVLSTDGDTKLGGDDIDLELHRIILKKLMVRGIDISKISREDKEDIKLRLEKFKKSGVGSYSMGLDFKLLDEHGTRVRETISVESDDFYEATKPIYRKTKQLVDKVLANNLVEVNQMVLVGGSTKSEIIRQWLQEDYPTMKINFALNPDESVALGAGIQAYRTKYGSNDVQVFDVIPLAIGILTEGYVKKQIEANTGIPYSSYSLYSTIVDNQEFIDVAIYQGNSLLKEECTYLGNLIINNIPRRKAGEVTVSINLAINAQGILKCKVNLEGKTYEKELVNLLKGGTIKTQVNDTAVLRWKNFAKTLPSDKRNHLLRLIEEYSINKDIREDIIEYIRVNKAKPNLK
ncbi:Hsp70 family protein [uncultured Clostridium sp.]|uniref:Hsp70 family protein n=1 Tax=uncultured Clostridium sp. TaxID=59620 RepID=UPI0026F40061|nr:Hsp70 family protein [uncultured Clostridium sp.]